MGLVWGIRFSFLMGHSFRGYIRNKPPVPLPPLKPSKTNNPSIYQKYTTSISGKQHKNSLMKTISENSVILIIRKIW
jgi:hypothetical protein